MDTLIKNRYRLQSLIGQGGMGAVYLAYDRLTSDIVALKQVTVPKKHLDLITLAPPTFNHNAVLANEFSTLASLRHPNIIRVLDYGFDHDGNPFFTMDVMVEGVPITDYAKDKSEKAKISYLIDILQALRYLHQRGILHRDLKPANILVNDDKLKLLDFGLALDAQYSKDNTDAAGTLTYLAPEVLRGTPPSLQSDLYAFGVIAYEILTGRYPFPHVTQSQLIQQLLMDTPDFSQSGMNDAVSQVIMRLLSKNMEDRYGSALDTIRALSRAIDLPVPVETHDIRESFLVASKFVGRKKELDTLTAGIDQMLTGKGQVYLIGGESGTGKTRLLNELRSIALVRGVTVIRGQAITEAGQPYKIWRDILPHLLILGQINDEDASILAHLVPQIRDFIERPVTPSNLPDNTVKARLPLAIGNLMQSASEQTPLLILLEDLQWADSSLEILQYIVTTIPTMKVILAANYRDDEAPHLAEKLQSMTNMGLTRLSDDEVRQLSSAMLGQQAQTADVMDLLTRESEGNAFFLVEVVRALAEETGTLSKIGQETLPAHVFTGGIGRVIERRIERLPEWATYAVQVSAISGRQVKPALIAHIFPDLDLEEWLLVCGEVAIFEASGEQWRFTHDKIREYVITQLDETQTANINRQVAEAIEFVHAGQIEQYASVLSDYYLVAGDNEKSGLYAIKAANVLRAYDPLRAYDLSKRAIALHTEQYSENPAQVVSRLQHLLGRTALRTGKYAESRAALDRALAGYEQLGDDLHSAKVKNNIGELAFKMAKTEGVIEMLLESLPVLEAHDDWWEMGSVYMHISIIYAQEGHLDKALPYFHKCLETTLHTGDEIEISKAYNNLAIAIEIKGDIEESLRLHHKALDIRRRLNDRSGIGSSLQNLAGIEFRNKNYEKARELRLEALDHLRAMGNKIGEANAIGGLAQVENTLGNTALALSYAQEAIDLAIMLDNQLMESIQRLMLARFRADDDPRQAIEDYQSAVRVVRISENIPVKIEAIETITEFYRAHNWISPEKAVEWLSGTLQFSSNYQNMDRIETQVETLKSYLADTDFAAAQARGQALNLDTVLDDILATGEKHPNE